MERVKCSKWLFFSIIVLNTSSVNSHFLIEDFNLVSASLLQRLECQRAFRLAGEALVLLPFSYMTEDATFSGNSS